MDEITLTSVLLAFGLTLLAGLSTGIGSLMAIFAHRTNTRFLAASLGFSAGVMVYVSFVELLVGAFETLSIEFGAGPGPWIALLAFFVGVAIIGVIDRLVPEIENPHEIHFIEEMESTAVVCASPDATARICQLKRLSIFTALAITIHNFPEGLATFSSSIKDIHLGIPIAFAIAIHNIPEGISVSIPVYYATGSRKKAFFWSLMSGLAEPLGAIIGFLLLMPFLSGGALVGILFAMVAGIMVYISLDELLPAAEKYGEHHAAIYGLIAGMAVMGVSLLMFGNGG